MDALLKLLCFNFIIFTRHFEVGHVASGRLFCDVLSCNIVCLGHMRLESKRRGIRIVSIFHKV